MSQQITIISWNINYENNLKKDKLKQIFDIIWNYDVILLQEISFENISNFDNEEYEQFLLQKKKKYDRTSVILCKKHLNPKFTFFNSTSISIEINNIIIVNVHLKAGLQSGELIRINQLNSTLKKVKEFNNVILIGDFNDLLDIKSNIYDILMNNKFIIINTLPTCYYPDYKYCPWDKLYHITYKNLNIKYIEFSHNYKIEIPNDNFPSDHLPIICKLFID